MPSISLGRRTLGTESRGSGHRDPDLLCFFTKMLAPSPRAEIRSFFSADVQQINIDILESLLADTPAFSVGLLGFAVLTFFLILKKANLASLCLLFSVLLTFFAALTDLGQLYLRRGSSTEYPSQQSVHSLMIIREILYSIASGLRSLFYWVYVSQPPLCEQDSAPFLRSHSGSWQHWGTVGSVLRWTTLAVSLLLPVLQALWRTVDVLHEFGPVYDIENAVEIILSAVFIIKLLLNVWIVELSSRRQTLWQYFSVLSALLIGMGVGIGNLTHFAFSEITLGRLLLAAEFHILVVSVMVFAFYRTKTAEGSTRPSFCKRESSFRGLRLSLYDTGPELFDPYSISPTQPRRPSVQDTSSWLGRNARSTARRQFVPMPEEDEKQFRAKEPARGPSTYPSEKAVFPVNGETIPVTEKKTRWHGPTYQTSGFNSSIAATNPLPPVIAHSPSSLPMPASLVGVDSPVLGSDGASTTRKNRPPPKLHPLRNASFASIEGSNYESLFREQLELERGIAALRDFARSEDKVARDTVSDLPEQDTARESSTTGNGHTSVSGKSDFSLSVFPEPPQMPQFEADYGSNHLSSPSVLLPPRTSIFTAGRGFPTSSDVGTIEFGFGLRTASVGTHYDVTSFIGDLSSPDESTGETPNPSDTESEPGSVVQATIVTLERKTSGVVRPLFVKNPSLPIDVPTSAISGFNDASARDAGVDPSTPKQLSPGSTFRVSPPPAIYTLEAWTRQLTTPTKHAIGLPSRPKLNISPSIDHQHGDVPDTPRPVVTQPS